jgi:hypothetical protein
MSSSRHNYRSSESFACVPSPNATELRAASQIIDGCYNFFPLLTKIGNKWRRRRDIMATSRTRSAGIWTSSKGPFRHLVRSPDTVPLDFIYPMVHRYCPLLSVQYFSLSVIYVHQICFDIIYSTPSLSPKSIRREHNTYQYQVPGTVLQYVG